MSEHLLFAFGLDGSGGGTPLNDETVVDWLNDTKLAWAHLDANEPGTRNWLNGKAVRLDPFVIDALLSEETRPRMMTYGDGCLLIFRGVNMNEGAEPEDMVSLRLWVEQHRIISLSRRRLRAIDDLKDRIVSGKGPKESGQFIGSLVTRLNERIEPVLSSLDEKMDDIEENVVESGDFSLRQSIIDVRKQAIMFRRYLAPQRDAVGQLRNSEIEWLDATHRRNLYENHNHLLRFIEDLDAIRERAQIVKDELTAMLADRLNKNMYILSVIAAIFLPLGFLTGLLGINVGGIPGAENRHAFLLFCVGLTVIVSAQIYIFKKLKWI